MPAKTSAVQNEVVRLEVLRKLAKLAKLNNNASLPPPRTEAKGGG
jgi:hypothetical protein